MSAPSPTKASLSSSKVPELKALCSKYGLPVSGNKSDLINRLMTHYEMPQSDSALNTPIKEPTMPSKLATSIARSDAPNTRPAATTAAPSSQPAFSHKSQVDPAEPTNPITVKATTDTVQSIPKLDTDVDPIDAEIEKRKMRAERFGIPTNPTTTSAAISIDEEELRKLNRAKRFGIAPDVESGLKALDQPLKDGKRNEKAPTTSELEWEARKRQRAEKFGLVDNPTPLKKDGAFRQKFRKFHRRHKW
ncbi:hypothetical protein O181_006849 [Austropuccinia psidii MF-1]|uniref:SAP domain-containing protein n=1 Tax=Austropuccinia psidii MF-1 TaxID=1389203 RepID=A0A9Q3BKT7_9BASI|nr:hypothetical protein [Austropuccinia psidii MF-1]